MRCEVVDHGKSSCIADRRLPLRGVSVYAQVCASSALLPLLDVSESHRKRLCRTRMGSEARCGMGRRSTVYQTILSHRCSVLLSEMWHADDAFLWRRNRPSCRFTRSCHVRSPRISLRRREPVTLGGLWQGIAGTRDEGELAQLASVEPGLLVLAGNAMDVMRKTCEWDSKHRLDVRVEA